MSAVPTLAESISLMLERRLLDLYTTLPARVLEYFPDEQKVHVQPLLHYRPDDQSLAIKLPRINDVPVVFQSSGESLMSSPITADTMVVDGDSSPTTVEGRGDTVLLMFSKQSLDEWLVDDDAEETIPLSNHQHSLSDAIAITGLYNFKSHLSPDPDNPEWKFRNSSIKLRKNVEEQDWDNSDVYVDTQGHLNIRATKNATINIEGAEGMTINVTGGDTNITTSGETNISSGGDVNVTGQTINLN